MNSLYFYYILKFNRRKLYEQHAMFSGQYFLEVILHDPSQLYVNDVVKQTPYK
jgi:hypothetical protein